MSSEQPSYLEALREPGVARTCAAGVVARLPESMTIICLLLLAHARGGYAVGGVDAALVGVAAAVSGPLWGRAADRAGVRRVLLGTGLASAAALALLPVAVRHSDALGLLVSALVGAVRPPVAGVVRARWAALPPGPRRAMQALESALTELVYIIGPALVTVVLLVGSAAAGLYAGAVMVGLGAAVLASSPAPAPLPREHHGGWLGPIRLPALQVLCGVFGLQVMAFAVCEVGVTALCTNRGQADLTGLLLATWGVGSAGGGLLYGVRRFPLTPRNQLQLLCISEAVLMLGFAASGNPYVLFAFAIPAGLSIAPAAQTVTGLTSRVVPAGQLTEAYGWLSAAAPALGSSAGSALGAAVAQGSGPRVALVLAAAVSALAPLLVAAARRALPAD